MGGLIGFILGYYLGLKERPERLDELRQAVDDIVGSRDFQALTAGAQMALASLSQRLNDMGKDTSGTGGQPDLAAAWRTIVESAEFQALLSTGTALLEDLARRQLSQLGAAPARKGNGRASAFDT